MNFENISIGTDIERIERFENKSRENDTHFLNKIFTEKENSLWQIFSIYHIPTTNDYLQTEFKDEREYQRFLNILKNRSNHNFNTSITSNDTILTLSTCYNDSEKMVVNAKLIKKQKNTKST